VDVKEPSRSSSTMTRAFCQLSAAARLALPAAGAAGLHKLTSRVFRLGSEQATYGDRCQTSRGRNIVAAAPARQASPQVPKLTIQALAVAIDAGDPDACRQQRPGALWSRALIEETRWPVHRNIPDLVRIVVAIDPAVSTGEDADETGIIVAGKDADGHGYVLADQSARYAPTEWVRTVVPILGPRQRV
jgi:hypothetical protein